MKKLKRSLGLGSVIAISVSAMLGSGIFVLPGLAVDLTGPSVWVAYLLAGITVLPAAFSKSELATAMPTSGGTYVYIERTFGPMAGTIAGLGLWLSLLLKSAFALVGLGAYLDVLVNVPLELTSLGILLTLVILNIIGVGKVSSVLVVVISVSVTWLLVICSGAVIQLDLSMLTPLFPEGVGGLMAATAVVFVSYAGVTKVAAIAEEIKDPEKNLPRGILTSLLLVTLLYCFVSFLLVTNLPIESLKMNIRPIFDLAQKVFGDNAAFVTAILAILTMSSMTNSGILAASRFPFAMARDHLLPSRMGRLNRRFLTPIWSIVASGAIVAITITSLDVVKIAKLASVFILMIYMVENITVIVLRELRVQWYRPSYKSPFYPWLQIFGIICTLALLWAMGHVFFPAILSISIPGFILYAFYSRKRTDRIGVIGIRGKRQDLIVDKELPSDHKSSELDLSIDASVVVSLFGKERAPETLIEMGMALAEHKNIEVAHITEVPEQTNLDDIMEEPAELRSLRRRVVAMAMEKKEPVTFDPIVSHDLSRTIFEISQRLHCKWLLTEWRGKTSSTFTLHNPMDWLKNHLECNLGFFRDAGVRYIRKILVLVGRDGNNDNIAVDTADHLAEINKAEITFLIMLPEKSSDELVSSEKKKLLDLPLKYGASVKAEVIKCTTKNQLDAIIGKTIEHDLFVFGCAPQTYFQSFFGSFDDRLMAKAACSVISVQKCSKKNL